MNWIAYPVFPAPTSGFASGRPAPQAGRILLAGQTAIKI
jgi:hypothetical protein